MTIECLKHIAGCHCMLMNLNEQLIFAQFMRYRRLPQDCIEHTR